MKKNIGILGATGLVGSSVLSALQGKGYLSKNTFMEIVIFRMELHKM